MPISRQEFDVGRIDRSFPIAEITLAKIECSSVGLGFQ